MPVSIASRLPVSLALQGGGAWGAYTWGVLERLLSRTDLDIRAISGTSAGAVNGAIVASALATGSARHAQQALESFWQAVATKPGPANVPWLGPLGPMSERMGLTAWRDTGPSPYQINPLRLNPLRPVVADHVDIEAIRAGRGPALFVGATHARTGQPRVFGPTEISLDALMASACIPQFFHAVRIDGEHYWDGAYSANPAIWPLIEHGGASDLLLVQLNADLHARMPREATRIRQRVNDLSMNACLVTELNGIHRMRAMLRDTHPQLPLVRMHLHRIGPPQGRGDSNGTDEFDRSWSWLRRLRRQGQAASAHFLAEHGADLGVRSTMPLDAASTRIEPGSDGSGRSAVSSQPSTLARSA